MTTTTCVGCAAQIVPTTIEMGGFELPAPVEHGVALPEGGYTVELCPGGGWPGMPGVNAPSKVWRHRTEAMAAAVLALPMGGEWAAPGMPVLALTQRSFPAGVPSAEVVAGTATPEAVTLAEGGSLVHAGVWCQCNPGPGGAEPVYFERWNATGRVAHGWACAYCRRMCQSG